MWLSARRHVGAVLGALLVLVGTAPALAQDTPELSAHGENASEEEREYFRGILPCPVIADWENDGRNDTSEWTFSVSIGCTYRTAGGDRASFRMDWDKQGDEAQANSCIVRDERRVSDNEISDVVRPGVPASIQARYTLSGETVSQEEAVVAAIDGLLAAAAPFALPCVDPPIAVTCPALDGREPDEVNPFPDGAPDSSGYVRWCRYAGADGEPAVEIEFGWAPNGSNLRQLPFICSVGTGFADGFGTIGAAPQAAYAEYWIKGLWAGVEEPAETAARDLVDQVLVQARECPADLVRDPDEAFSALPPWASSIVGASTVTRLPDPEPAADTTTTTTAATTATTAGTATGSTATTAPPSEPAGEASSLARLLTIGALILSIAGIGLTFLLARKETRVRPGRDVLRIAITLAIAVGSAVVFSRTAPLWAIGTGIGLGLLLGAWQGSNLIIRFRGEAAFARRSGTAILALGAGIAVTQIAGLLGRSGAVTVGIGVSFLSAATAAGLMAARSERITAARSAAAILAVAVAAGIVGGAAPTSAQESELPPAVQQVVDRIDWTQVTFLGGLGWQNDKPPLIVSIPPMLGEPPDPIERTVSWLEANDVGPDANWEIAERFEFSLDANGNCCSVEYSGSGTSTSTSEGSEPVERVAEGRLWDIFVPGSQSSAFGPYEGLVSGSSSRPAGPFPVSNPFEFRGEDQCWRAVAEPHEDFARLGDHERGGTWDVFRIGDRDYSDREESSEFIVMFVIGCDVEGLTYPEFLDLAEPPPVQDAEERNGCPVLQEWIGPIVDVGDFGEADVGTISRLAYSPNEPACQTDFDVGRGGRGGTRHEVTIRLWPDSPTAYATTRADVEDTFFTLFRWWNVPEAERCEVGSDGLPIRPPEGETCQLASMHRVDAPGLISNWRQVETTQTRTDSGYRVWMYTDYDDFDGPNVIVRAILPWGEYRYRCHHCEPGDDRIAAVLETIDQTGVAQEVIDLYTPDPDTDGSSATDAPGTTAATTGTTSAGTDGETVDDEPAGDEDLTDEAAIAALIGVLGVTGILSTTLIETGGSIAEIFDRLKPRQPDGSTGPPPPLDEHGDPMTVNDGSWPDVPEGHVWWDDGSNPRWIPPDEAAERVTAEREAMAGVQAHRDRIITDHETGSRDRFDAMDERSRRRAAAEQQVAREAPVPRVRSRDEILAALEAAEREQEQATEGWWDNFLETFWDGTYNDTMSLPGVAVDAGIAARDALDATYDAVTDPENWRIAGETIAQTAVDIAGTFVGRTDAVDKAADSFGKAAGVARAVGSAIVKDPWGFAKSVTPIEAFEKGVDPDVPLGQRIASIWMGSLDVAVTIASGGAAKVADTGIDLARAADAVSDAARAADRIDDTLDAARAADRVADAADASRAADRLDDSLDAARAADRLDDTTDAARAAETARTPGGRRIPTNDEVAMRREAWEQLRARGKQNVDEFERVIAEGGDARAAALRVQADKNALRQINERSEDARAAMNAQMRQIYDEVDDKVLREVAERNGMRGPIREVPDAGTPAGHRVFVDADGNELHILEPTNPSSVPKVGADRDYTMRIRRNDPEWTRIHGTDAVDVDSRIVQQVYDDAFYDVAGGDEMFDALGLADEPGKMRSTVFAERMDQVATDKLHPEAYTDIQRVIGGPGADLTDPQQVGLTVGYKGEHWINRADAIADPLAREDFVAEGMRQLTKQTDNQAIARLEAINSQRAVAGLSEARMPDRLQQAVDIMRQVNPKPGSGVAAISPAEAEHLLSTVLDTDVRTVATELGGFVEALDKLGSRNDAFDAFRNVAATIAERP